MNNRDEEPLCARCAKTQKTCCQASEIYVTPGDVRRIRAERPGLDFSHDRRSDDPDVTEHDDDPEWYRTFNDDGSRRVLRQRSNGDCTFLGPVGCTLDLEVRPIICRLYPLDYTASGFREYLVPRCPTGLLRSQQTLLGTLGMSPEGGDAWRLQLYEEIQEEPNPPIAPAERDRGAG